MMKSISMALLALALLLLPASRGLDAVENYVDAQIQVTVDAGTTIRTIDERVYGINVAIWDGLLSGADNDGLLRAMGTRVIRFPGGSSSDDYDWQTNRSVSTGGPFQWVNNAATFARVAEQRGAQAYVTVNYGSGTPEQAAAWVAYYNADAANMLALGTDAKGRDWKTVGFWAGLRASAPLAHDDGYNFLRAAHPAPYGIRYWEVGNECYGFWEYDQHGASGSGLSGTAHDGATYATVFKLFYAQMLAVDATIHVGAVFDSGFVKQLAAQGTTPHFMIYHRYPQSVGGENDATLLQSAGGVASDAAAVRGAITSAFGAAQGAGMELAMTELNSTVAGVGKQSVSLVNALFMADSAGFVARSEFSACMWWDLRNGTSSGNSSASLYGWRTFGDYGVLASGDRGDTPANTPYPTFYAAKLLTHWGRGGDAVVAAGSNSPLISAHAARLANGNLALLLINRNSVSDHVLQISISGFTPDAAATLYQYGKSNDLTNADLSVSALSGAAATFSLTVPSYSMSVLVLRPNGTPAPVAPLLTSGPLATPNPAEAGIPVAFSAAATGTQPSFAWTFGDGTNGTGATPSHVYTTPGQFTAVLNIIDDNGGVASGSVDVRVNAAVDMPLMMTGACIKLNFRTAHRDAITLSGTLPVTSGFLANGQSITVSVGGIIKAFTLNPHGRATDGRDSFTLTTRKRQGTVSAQDARFSACFPRGDFTAALSPLGMGNQDASSQNVFVPLMIRFNGLNYTANPQLHYSARMGVGGVAK